MSCVHLVPILDYIREHQKQTKRGNSNNTERHVDDAGGNSTVQASRINIPALSQGLKVE